MEDTANCLLFVLGGGQEFWITLELGGQDDQGRGLRRLARFFLFSFFLSKGAKG